VRTKMGRRVRVTPDHPFVVADAAGTSLTVKSAAELGESDWLPVAQGSPASDAERWFADPLALAMGAEVSPAVVKVRLGQADRALLAAIPGAARNAAMPGRRSPGDVLRTGVVRLDEAMRLDMSLDGASYGTARNGTWVPAGFEMDEDFWRVVGLYVAEGHMSADA